VSARVVTWVLLAALVVAAGVGTPYRAPGTAGYLRLVGGQRLVTVPFRYVLLRPS
jgi:hypothetical protein